MAISDLHPLDPAQRSRPLMAAARAWSWLTAIESPDPVRRRLNRALVPIYLLYALLAVLVMLTQAEPWRRMVTLSAAVVCVAGLLLNRRDARGPALLTACATVGIALLVPRDTYLLMEPHFSLPGELFLPIIIAALFVSPLAGGVTCLAVLAIISLTGALAGAPPEAIVRFNMLGGTTLIGITALLAVGASQFTAALRRSYEANRELELRVERRTADLADANHALADAKAHIEQIAELRVKEIAEVVHDARNQLMHIRAAADQLADSEAGSDRASAQRTIETALRSQQDLLDAMLEAALLDAGSLILHPEPASITDLVEQAVSQMRPRYEQRRCALLVERLGAVPAVTCDARRIRRVLHNLLNNALSYTTSAHADGGEVRVSFGREGDEVVVRVADNGIGIAPEQLPLVGQRLVRVVGGRSAPEGTGLGLSASMGVVKLHGGRLQLMSEGLGRGALAELRLPLTPSGDDPDTGR